MVSAKLLYVFGVGFSGLLPLALLRSVLRNRTKPGATGLLIAIPSVSLWSLGLALNLAAQTPLQWYLTATATLLFTELAVIGWVLTAAEYTSLRKPTRRFVGALVAFPLLMQVVAWTNPLHHLLYPPLDAVALGEPLRISMSAHPMVAVHTLVSYLGFLVGFGLIVRETVRTQGIRQRQSLALTVSALLPIVPNVFYIADVTRFQLTPVAFVGTMFVLSWALVRADFLDVVPVGRNRAVESMDDPVVTLDEGGRVVDSNPAARAFVDAGRDWEGAPVADFFDSVPEISAHLDGEPVETELSVTDEGKPRHFVLNASPIRGLQDERRGTLVVLQEFTELKERERDLDLLRQVQSRVLRHNIRNDVGVLKTHSELFAEEFEDRHGEMAERMVDTAEDLISVSNKARDIEKLVEQDQTSRELDLASMLRNLVGHHRKMFREVTFDFDGPATCTVETIPSVELAIENLVENAAEHNDAEDPSVDVTVTCGDEAVVTVSDNGPGIPEYELAVLEQGEETPLQHGSGVGLWVIDWVVKNSAATVDFGFDGEGSVVTVRLPLPEKADAGDG